MSHGFGGREFAAWVSETRCWWFFLWLVPSVLCPTEHFSPSHLFYGCGWKGEWYPMEGNCDVAQGMYRACLWMNNQTDLKWGDLLQKHQIILLAFFLCVNVLQLTGPCTFNMLLSSVSWLESWEIQIGEACARCFQMFVGCCRFIFRMYHLPVTVVWSIVAWVRWNVQHRERVFPYFFIHFLKVSSLLFSITGNMEQEEVISMHWTPLLIPHSYP